jgi:hypothetical protein
LVDYGSWEAVRGFNGCRSPKRILAASYAYACGDGKIPRELHTLNCIDRFGVESVLGRVILGAKEVRVMAIAENIVNWYNDRKRAENQAEWANEHTEDSAALTVAYRLAKERGLLKDG